MHIFYCFCTGFSYGIADGDFGSITEQAIKDFQGANGITQTGVADEFTLQMLFSNLATAKVIEEEEPTELEVVESEIPESAQTVKPAATQAPTESAIPATEMALQTSKLSEKALAGIADTMSFETDASGNNFQFIFWLLVMIIVMGITFAIVSAVEKKKTGKKTEKRYF